MNHKLTGLLALIFMPILAWSTEPTKQFDNSPGKQFIAAKRALNQGNTELFLSLKDALHSHPLHTYLEYYFLRKYFETLPPEKISQFIEQHPKSPMAKKLRDKRLTQLAEQNRWQAFLKQYVPEKNTRLTCYYFEAMRKTHPETKIDTAVKKVWLQGKNLPENCNVFLAQWLQDQPQKHTLIWSRFELALKKYNFKLARNMLALMSTSGQKQAQAILRLYKNPTLVTNATFIKQHPSAEVISYGIARIARRSPYSAINLWKKYQHRYEFNEAQKQRMFQGIALKLALRKKPESTLWFRKLIGRPLDKVYQEWLIRAAIYHGDWQLVHDNIQALPEQEQVKPKWRYWHGRALKKLGEESKSSEIMQQLATERHYHGFLASRFLGKKVSVEHHPLNPTEAEIDQVRLSPEFQRAKWLYALNQKYEARLELYYMIKHGDTLQQYIVMKLVSEWNWPAQVLRLSRYANHKDDIHMRFPLEYHATVMSNASERKINPALVYAIIRQESYFMPKAGSHAGAIGLMQLMPKTALKTSHQYKLKYSGRKDLLHGETNIRFGSAHLNKLHEQFENHPILVIAAYNAGRKAVNRWIPKGKKIPADIWIETVPFYETRNYIKHVIAYYIIYQHRLGQIPDLDSMMQQVK